MMVHRSIFNDPSPHNSDNDRQGSDGQHHGSPASRVSDDHTSESEDQSLSENEFDSDEGGDDEGSDEGNEDDEDGDEELTRWGGQEDTRTTINPYLGVLASLEQDHNTSLSKHLYSAHLLRKQQLVPRITLSSNSDSASASESADPRPKKRQKRVEQVPDSEEDDDKCLFGRGKRFVTKTWTSWPHPPSFVPRESEHKISRLKFQPPSVYFDPETYSQPLQPPIPPPSQMLEETLVAAFLKFSKDKFLSRPTEEVGGAEPALDDDVSEHVLKPVVRHVISQLDGLLTGLYHERGHVKAFVEEDGIAAAATEKAKNKRRLNRYMRAKARGRVVRKRIMTPTTDTEEEEEGEGEGEDDEDSNEERDPDNDDGEGTPPKKAQKSKRRRRHPAPAPLAEKYAAKRQNRLRLRDWSQVLGIAALIGWEEDALQRAVKRCEEQFDQTMSWRRLKEGNHTEESKSDEIWDGARLTHLTEDMDEDEDVISRDGFMQPIKLRKIEAGERVRYRVKMTPRMESRGHMDKVDGNTPVDEVEESG